MELINHLQLTRFLNTRSDTLPSGEGGSCGAGGDLGAGEDVGRGREKLSATTFAAPWRRSLLNSEMQDNWHC